MPDDVTDAVSALRKDLAMAELAFHRERIAAGSDLVSNVGQFIFLIFGAIVLASSRVPETIVVLPLFWTAWLFHSLQRTSDTAKHALLARRAEVRLNAMAQEPIALWTTTSTTGAAGLPRSWVSVANFAYWGLLYLGAWTAAIVVLCNRGHAALGILGASFAVAVLIVVALLCFVVVPKYERASAQQVESVSQAFPTQ